MRHSGALWPTPMVAAAGVIYIELIVGLMKKPLQDDRNADGNRATATVSTSLWRTRFGRYPSALEENSPRLSTKKFPFPQNPFLLPTREAAC